MTESAISGRTWRRSATGGNLPSYVEPNSALLVLFLGYVGYLYLQVGYRIPALGAIRFEFLLGAVLGVFAVVVLARQRELIASPVLPWVSGLLLLALIMVPASVAPAYSWDIFVDRVLKFAMMTAFIVAFASSPRALKWFIAMFLLAFLRMAYEGILGLRDGSLIWENQGVLRLHGATPIYMHPNSFGGTQLGVLPFCFYLFRAARTRWLRALLSVQAAASAIIVLYTGSRTTYLGLAGLLIYLVLAARSRFKALMAVMLVVGITAPLIPEQYIERAETIATQQDKEGASIELRKEIYRDAWAVFTEHPLGVGVSAFPIVRRTQFGRTQDTHNLYLEVATNLGVPGLILFGGFVFSLYVTLRKAQRSFEEQSERMRQLLGNGPTKAAALAPVEQHCSELKFLEAMAEATIGFLVIRLVLGVFGHDLYEIYWWFMAGIALSLAYINRTAMKRTEALRAIAAQGAAPISRPTLAGA